MPEDDGHAVPGAVDEDGGEHGQHDFADGSGRQQRARSERSEAVTVLGEQRHQRPEPDGARAPRPR